MNVEQKAPGFNAPVSWSENEFENVEQCPLCQSLDLVQFLTGVQDWHFETVPGKFDFAKCGSCASLVLLKRPKPENALAAYSSYYTHGQSADMAPQRGLMQRAFRVLSDGYVANTYRGSSRLLDRAFAAAVALLPTRRAEIDARYRYLPNDPAKVLDYGCGDGTFLKVAQGLGHQVVGVDFDQEALASARGKCIDVLLPNELDQQNPYSLYDHLTLSHVIEHLDDPLGLLRKCRNWLKPTGTLYIEVPNSNARGLGNFGGFWRGLEVPRHFSVPSSNGLKRALEAAGFDVIFLGTRAFAHVYMDAASEAARNKFDCNVGLDPPQQTITQIKLDSATTSAEMLTCLARPCKAVEI